jgi:hypothetical protein
MPALTGCPVTSGTFYTVGRCTAEVAAQDAGYKMD